MTGPIIRPLQAYDVNHCVDLVSGYWDEQTAKRARKQISLFSNDGAYGRPVYFVADLGGLVVGFAGVRPSHLFRGAWEIPWIVVAEEARDIGVGHRLMDACFAEIGRRHGALVLLMTEIPNFFKKFGFQTAKKFDGWSLMTLKLCRITLGDLIA